MEKDLEQKLKVRIESEDGMCLKFSSPGTRGVMDRIVLWDDGTVCFIEVKQLKGRLSPLQKKMKERFESKGFRCYVVRSEKEIEEAIENEKNIRKRI